MSLTIYIGIALGIILQGEIGLIGAGHLISTGTVNFWLVVLVGTILSTVNGEFFFTLSRLSSKLIKSKKLNDGIARAKKLIDKYDAPLLLFSRFVYGIRNLIPIAFAFTDIKHVEFSILNVIGASIWAITFTTMGFASGKALSLFLDLKRYQMLMLGIILGIAFTSAMLKITKTKKENKTNA
jgi:membrane protein DedA with SNARE-associated domain